MGRSFIIAGLLTLLIVPLVPAMEYVPGQHRPDGLYVPPHFQSAAGARHAAEAWYETLRTDGIRGPATKAPPAATADAPSAPPDPAGRTAG
jgi:hypothetical protein